MKKNIKLSSALVGIALMGFTACQPASDGSDSATNTPPDTETMSPSTGTTTDMDTATVLGDTTAVDNY